MPPKKDVNISFNDLEKSMTTFTGDYTYPIAAFISDFEDVASLMEWSDVEKLVYAKRLLGGTAKLFLRSLGKSNGYKILKEALEEEFGPKFNSATIHKRMSIRKMKSEETLQQYFLVMKEMALHGKVEDEALMEYVIDGIRDLEFNKSILYGASDLKNFRKKLDIYDEMRKKMSSRTSQISSSSNQQSQRKNNDKRCFKCGDLNHQAPECTKGIKCFKCNDFGHKSTECTPKQKTLNISHSTKYRKVPLKKVKINDVELISLIDTGSDVNLIRKTEFEKINERIYDYNSNSTITLTGIAEKRIKTEGAFTVKVQIDDDYADLKFHIVNDNELPVMLIIGTPILEEFEVNFTTEGVYMRKIIHSTLLIEANEKTEEFNLEDSRYTEDLKKMINDYKPKEERTNSNNELRADESPTIYQSPRRLSPLETDIIPTKTVEVEMAKKTILENGPHKNYILQDKILYEEKYGGGLILVHKKMQTEIIEGNGRVDRIHQLIINVLSKLSTDDPTEWYRRVSSIQRCLYGTSQRSIGMTPFEVPFGAEMIDKDDELTKLIEKDDELTKLIEKEVAHRFYEKRQELREKSKESIHKVQKENVRNYKKKRREAISYSLGDLVAIKSTQFTQGSKLIPKYLGPYEIVMKKRNDRYAVKKIGHGEGPINTTSSADLMKPWVSAEDSSSGTDEEQDGRVG